MRVAVQTEVDDGTKPIGEREPRAAVNVEQRQERGHEQLHQLLALHGSRQNMQMERKVKANLRVPFEEVAVFDVVQVAVVVSARVAVVFEEVVAEEAVRFAAVSVLDVLVEPPEREQAKHY